MTDHDPRASTGRPYTRFAYRNGEYLDGGISKRGFRKLRVEVLEFNVETGIGLADYEGMLVSFRGRMVRIDE